MDLREFYQLILRNLSIVIIFTLIGFSSAFGISKLMTPMYEAKTQLFVSTPSSSLDLSAVIQGSSFSQQRVKSYAQIINGPATLYPVINKLNLETSIEDLSSRVKATAPLDTVLINLTVRDESPNLAATIANEVSIQFATTVNQLELAEEKKFSPIKVSVVKYATIPKSPSSPRLNLNLLLGLILGAGLGISIGLIKVIFDRTVKKEEDLGTVSLLAVIGFDKEAKKKPLLSQLGQYHPRTEAFRQLRTNIQHLKNERPDRVINITSALPGEGKSTSVINLGISFANAGMKVLIIEADLRRPKISNYLGLSKESTGLAELLEMQSPLTEQSVLDSVFSRKNEKIDVIPSGKIPSNPAELLESPRFQELLNFLRPRYDYIFIDCPPAIPVADATIIGNKVDGTIIIVRAGETRIEEFLGVNDSLINVNAKVIGAVLNMIPKSRIYGDYGYRYGYGYGYGYGKYRSYNTYNPESDNSQNNKSQDFPTNI